MDLKRHCLDLARRAARSGEPCFTRFLEPSQEDLARQAAREGFCRVEFYGGWEEAERRMAAFCPDETSPERFPITALQLRWNPRFAAVGHRDLLGAVMALGIERDTFGDICLSTEAGCAYLFSGDDMAGYFIANLTQAGRASLRVSPAKEISVAPPEGDMLRLTVQQLRLDAVLAAGCRLSRAEAQRLIRSGLVKLNHAEELRVDAHLSEGDLISCKGYGRLRLVEIQGETRRGRLAVTAFRTGK